jgi:hypothetical protein
VDKKMAKVKKNNFVMRSSATIMIMFLLCTTPYINGAEGGKHHAGVFMGGASNFSYPHTNLSIGVDYEYGFSRLFGLGLVGEAVFAKHTETIIMMSISMRPIGGLKISGGFGSAFANSESHMIYRIGTGYEFHTGILSIIPTFNIDFTNGQTYGVYGLTFGTALN